MSMSIFAIADLHLSFAPGSDKPMDIFGSRWKDHPERIKENWCSNVTEQDTVVVAGDISWALKLEDAVYDLDWIDALPGHKVVLKGNHDLWWAGITRLNAMYEDMTFLQNDAFFVPTDAGGVWICGSRGWITPDDDDFKEADDKIYKREILRLRSSLDFAKKAVVLADSEDYSVETIGFLHYPPVAKAGKCGPNSRQVTNASTDQNTNGRHSLMKRLFSHSPSFAAKWRAARKKVISMNTGTA